MALYSTRVWLGYQVKVLSRLDSSVELSTLRLIGNS
jgi:hypothetical protein